MNKKQRTAFIRQWVKALRSGRYKQTHFKLYDGLGHCCLGVACRVKHLKFDDGREGFVHSGTVNNRKIYNLIPGLLTRDQEKKLTEFNDGSYGVGKSFKWLADYIEKYI